MRPDRIVVGEVRGAEAFELTRAINAGCGFMCTVHANSGPEALNALVNAALMAGENVTERIVRRVFSQALDVVVHVDRDDAPRGAGAVRRQVTEITAVVPTLGDEQTFEPIFVRRRAGSSRWSGPVRSPRASKHASTGRCRAGCASATCSSLGDDRVTVLVAVRGRTVLARSSRLRSRERCRAADRGPAAPVAWRRGVQRANALVAASGSRARAGRVLGRECVRRRLRAARDHRADRLGVRRDGAGGRGRAAAAWLLRAARRTPDAGSAGRVARRAPRHRRVDRRRACRSRKR